MEIELLLHLCEESHRALALLSDALTQKHSDCISEISECHRRATSALSDLYAHLFSVFLPPLPRTASAALGEALYAVIDTTFSTALLFPPHSSSSENHRSGELASLCRMSDILRDATATLPRFVRGKQPPLPDTYRFYAEQNKARAAHALMVRHTERTLSDRAIDESLRHLLQRISEAHRSLLHLMLESI